MKFNSNILYFHGTSNKIEKLKSPSASKPFFVCGDIDYAYTYAYATQINNRSIFKIKQEKPGFVYLVKLNSNNINLFDALDNNDISKLSRKYPKYIIENLKEKKWSIWSIFSYINEYLFLYYSKNFGNITTFKKFLLNKKFNDYFDNNLFFNGLNEFIQRYSKKLNAIYKSNDKWSCLFQLIELFNNSLKELGYNAFINRENVSKIQESEKIITKSAIGLFDIDCIDSGYKKSIPINTIKNVIYDLDKNNKYITTKNLINAIISKQNMSTNESKNIQFDNYKIIELTGSDLEAILPHLRPLIKQSYEKIGGKQGDRTVDQLKAVQTLAQVVYDKGKIIAYALAKKVHNNDIGNKINLIGCDQTWKGKEAMQAIIKYNIDNFNKNVWCECSGAIEHWFKKYDGYPIPNQLVPEIIGEPREKVWFHEDGYHYRRFLAAARGRFVQKIMFGFVNNEIMQKTLNQIGYDIMRNKINNKIHESNSSTPLEKAIQFVNELSNIVKNGELDIMLPSINAFLTKAIEILEKNNHKLAETGIKLQMLLKPIKNGNIK